MTKKKMEKAFKELKWFAFRIDFNTKKFEAFNVLNADLMNDLFKLHRKGNYTYEDIKNTIKTWGMYCYWCKAEHEFIVQDLFGEDIAKVDVWQQLEANLERLTDYIIEELFL